MGIRDINPSYDEVHPRKTRYIIAHQICVVGNVRVQLDGLTHDDVIWTPYEDYRLSRPFETIYLFSSHLRLGNLSQRHMPSVCCTNLATSRAFHHHRCRLRGLMHMSLIKGGCSLITIWWQDWQLLLVHLHVFSSTCLGLGWCHTHTFAEVSLEIDPVLYHVVAFVVQMLSRQVPRLKMTMDIR